MAKGKFYKHFISSETWLARAQNLWALATIPSLAGLLTAMLGYLQNLPLMWITIGGVVVFAYMATGLLRFQQWRTYNVVNGKIESLGPLVRLDCDWDKKGKPTKIAKMNGGLNFVNRSNFPLVYKFSKFQVIIAGRVADDSKLLGKPTWCVAGMPMFAHPDPVALGDLKLLSVSGTVEIEMTYGRDERMPYTLKKKYEFDVAVRKDESVKPQAVFAVSPREIA
jgi:hypothetical protein